MEAIAPERIQTRADLTGQLIALFYGSGKSIRGVAAAAGLSPATVSGIVGGTTGVPRTGTLTEFVKACGQEPGPWVAARGRVIKTERVEGQAAPQGGPKQELISINAVDDRHARALMLVDLASRESKSGYKREILSTAVQTARSISDSRTCARVLAEISPHLEPDQRRQALTDALNFIRSLPEANVRERTLREIAGYLDSEHLDQALDIAEALIESRETFALAHLAKHLKDRNDENRRALRVKALRIASEINDDMTRANVLEGLVSLLDRDQLTEVLEFVPQIENEATRASLLHKLAPNLDRGQRDRALTLARSIPSDYFRAEALAELGPYLSPEQLAIAIAAATDIRGKGSRRDALAALTALQTGPNQ